ncbi:MarR family transcriptional regulator [Roseovarius sp. SCSIO 43702]|nr:MarR family transcriptional regulator [Roseovarius sp. SCSIO 43702]
MRPDALDDHLRELLSRLSRVVASEGWGGDLNPVQRATLAYLVRANRFSRAPSQVADYLLATRGTVSQTLKALARKGLVEERRSDSDRRSIRYDVTAAGRELAHQASDLDAAIAALPAQRKAALAGGLGDLLRGTLDQRGARPFGICRTCRHHRPEAGPEGGAWCALLDVALSPPDRDRICHEHAPRDAA